MTKNLISNVSEISAIISYNYARKIEIHYDYFTTMKIVVDLSIEIFKNIEEKISPAIPVEFNHMVCAEAKRILQTNHSIHV